MIDTYYNVCRVMVAVSSDEGTVRECAERGILVLPLLVCEELGPEYMSMIALLSERRYLQTALRSVCKSIVDQQKVIYAPYSAVCKGAVAGLEHLDERAVEISFADIAEVLLSMKVLRHARIRRVVVHVTHADDLDARILLLHLHRMVVHDLAAAVTELVAALLVSRTRRKVGDIYRKVLTINESMNHEDITCLEIILLIL